MPRAQWVPFRRVSVRHTLVAGCFSGGERASYSRGNMFDSFALVLALLVLPVASVIRFS